MITTDRAGATIGAVKSEKGKNEKMKILVMGAGAIGAFVGAYLARAGEEVVFCARGAMLRGLRERGLTIGGMYTKGAAEPVPGWRPRFFA